MDTNAASQGQFALQIVAARQRRWWAGLALTALLALSIYGWYVVQLRAAGDHQAQLATQSAALALEGHVSRTIAAAATSLAV